jgi:nucleotide-binding universal stress UspA family protein
MNNQSASFGPEGKGIGSPRGPEIVLKDILVPVDFSPASVHGVQFAAAVARAFHAGLHLLHVVEPPSLPEWGYAHLAVREARLHQAATERLPKLAVECGIDPALVRSTKIRHGDSETEICDEAAAARSDLIVLASHGLGGLTHLVGASATLRVVRHAPCPVLTVRDRALEELPGPATHGEFKHLLVPTDFSPASKKALPYAVALARKYEAQLTLLFVAPQHLPVDVSGGATILDESDLADKAREMLPRFRAAELDPHLRVECVVTSGSPAVAITEAARNHGADLIVISTHGHAGLRRFMLGSVTEDVVRHAVCPVLVVREREHEFIAPPKA